MGILLTCGGLIWLGIAVSENVEIDDDESSRRNAPIVRVIERPTTPWEYYQH